MAKKIFDFGSNYIFGNWNILAYNDKVKEVEWPPWLTLPCHYAGNGWRRVKESYKGGNPDYELVITEECNHTLYIPRIRMYDQGIKRITYINCSKCGGTNEIR